MKSRALAVLGLVALCATGAGAGITTVDFSSNFSQHHLTQFGGVATYDSATGKLDIAVTNNTANGGFLTGIALSAAGPTLDLSNSGTFTDARNHKHVVNAGPLGKYHAGATTGANWSAGGRATQGIAAGGSRVFTFQDDSAGASSLTVADFFTPGKTGEEIVARFKKLPHHRNDRGGAVMSSAVSDLFASQFDPVVEVGLLPQDLTLVSGPTPQISTAAVPLPPAAWMALVTLLLIPLTRPLYRKKQLR